MGTLLYALRKYLTEISFRYLKPLVWQSAQGLLMFVLVFVLIMILRWVPTIQSYFELDSTFLKDILTSAGLSVFVKSILLDKFIGRHRLCKNGFVVRWSGFAWYILFTIPISIISGFALAISRFVLLMGICITYAVHQTTKNIDTNRDPKVAM